MCRQGDISDKTRHQQTGNNVLLPVPRWNPWVLQPPRGQLAVLLVVTCPVVVAGDFLHGVSSFVECSGCRAWHGPAASGDRAGMGNKEKQIHSHVPLVRLLLFVPLFSEKCCGWNISFGLHLLLLLSRVTKRGCLALHPLH